MLAVCVGVAAWAGLLALRRDALPEPQLAPIAPIAPLPRPQRLPDAPDFARTALPATATREHAERNLTIHVPDLPTALRALDGAGIATFDARTGADFRWLPLAGGVQAPDGGFTWLATTRVRGELVVALAAAPERARHGYLARTTFAAAGEALAVELPVVTATVQLALPPGSLGAGPLRLARVDDPAWLPNAHGATGVSLVPDATVELLLGAGTYELLDPIDPSQSQRFTVPGADTVVLTAALTRAPADRP